MTTPIRAVSYFRKSNEDDGQSVEQQRKWSRDQAPHDGAVVLREFSDQAVAGWDTARRSGFHRMLDYCREQRRLDNPVDAIYCWHTNRLSRADSLESNHYLHEFRQAGVCRIRTRERWYDLARKEDRALLNLEQDFTNAQYSIDLAAASLRGRLTVARDEGRRCGGPCPYAYRRELEEVVKKHGIRRWRTKRLVLGPDVEVATVRRIFAWYATGEWGVRRIAERLNHEKVPAPAGGEWNHQTVRRILQDEVYLGRNVWNRQRRGQFFGVVGLEVAEVKPGKKQKTAPAEWVRKDGTHDPVIDEQTFARCAAVLARRSKARNPGKGDFPLSGVLRCGHCGSAMTGRNFRMVRRGREYRCRRYECSGYMTSGKAKCHYGCVDADRLARAVFDKLMPPWLAENAEDLRAEILRQDREDSGPDPALLGRLRKRVARLEGEIDRATDELLRTDSEKQMERLRAKIREREGDLALARRELAEAEGREALHDHEAGVDAALAMLERLRQARDGEDRKAQKAVLHEAVVKVEVYFNREQRGERVRSTFAKALVWVPPELWAVLSSGMASVSTGS